MVLSFNAHDLWKAVIRNNAFSLITTRSTLLHLHPRGYGADVMLD